MGHERRRLQEPLPRARQRRALVADRRSHRLHRHRPSRAARRSSSATWTRKAPSRRSRASKKRPPASPGRPTARKLGFTMNVEAKNVWNIKLPRRPMAPAGSKRPRIVERLDYRQDGQGFDDDAYRHVFVVPATGGTPRQLTNGNWHHNGVEWTPDSKQILFGSNRVEDADYQWRESDIYSVNVDHRRHRAAHAPQGAGRQPAGVARRQARRVHGQRLVERHVAGQQALCDEHRRQQPAAGVGHVGSLAAERHVEGRRHGRVLHRAGSRARRTCTSCRSPARGRTKCRP